MKYYFLAFALLFTSVKSFAQQNEINALGCATQTSEAEIKEVYDYVQHPSALKTTAGVDTIPLTIHIVGTDNGSGRYQLDYLFRDRKSVV